MSVVSATLVYLRKQEDLTQEQAAKGLGMSRATLASYETARREPNMDTLKRFADFYHVRIPIFYDGPTEYYLKEKARVKSIPMDSEEEQVLKLFQSIPYRDREMVLNMIKAAIESCIKKNI